MNAPAGPNFAGLLHYPLATAAGKQRIPREADRGRRHARYRRTGDRHLLHGRDARDGYGCHADRRNLERKGGGMYEGPGQVQMGARGR